MKILESEVYTGDLVQGKTKIVDHQQVKAGEDNLIIANAPMNRSSAMSCLMQFRNTENRSVKKAKQLQNVPTHQTFSKVKYSVLIVAEAFTATRRAPERTRHLLFHCLTNSRVEKDSCKGAMIQEKELISTVRLFLKKS
ncbi:hypothetical protein MYD03_00370 [Mediterraneibacter gnavus]